MSGNIKNELHGFIRENYLFGEEYRFSDDDSFLERGIIDSTGILELIAFVEERYSLKIEDDELLPANLDSVNRLVRFIEGKRAAAAPAAAAGEQAAQSRLEPALAG
jgi:acyl carrier protein